MGEYLRGEVGFKGKGQCLEAHFFEIGRQVEGGQAIRRCAKSEYRIQTQAQEVTQIQDKRVEIFFPNVSFGDDEGKGLGIAGAKELQVMLSVALMSEGMHKPDDELRRMETFLGRYRFHKRAQYAIISQKPRVKKFAKAAL